MSTPFEKLQRLLDELTAAEILAVIEDEHKREYVKILVHPSQYEPVRQAVCNANPLMESAVRKVSIVKPNSVIFMDTSILEDWKPHFTVSPWDWKRE